MTPPPCSSSNRVWPPELDNQPDRFFFFFWHSYLLPCCTHCSALPLTITPLFSPPSIPLFPSNTCPQCQFTQCTPPRALVQRWAKAVTGRGGRGFGVGEGMQSGAGGRGSERKRLRDWNGYSGWNLGIKWTVGGECKTENKREAVIAGSPERNREIGVDYSKETDKAPLTAASSCFPRLCHHTTPPWCLFVFLIIYSTNCGVSAV